jgi:hypothetical protein
VPTLENVAVLDFAALVPFGANDTGAGGLPVVVHVYVRPPSPPASAPRTLNALVVPGAGLGVAAAFVATVGAAFGGAFGGVGGVGGEGGVGGAPTVSVP